jgi:hypothetical protein
MTDGDANDKEDGKEPYPDDIEAIDVWPDEDVELPYDETIDLEDYKEPYPRDEIDDGDA